ncbi:MAG: thiaminase II [Bacillota bacterium]|nr:thiaminase II [Bacillota bacterium]
MATHDGGAGAGGALGLPHMERLWASIAPVWEAIRRHPFLAGLAEGSLSRERFLFFVIQDALYLREYARALSLAAAKAPDEPSIALFARSAIDVVEGERQLHDFYFRAFGLTPEQVAATPPAPTNLLYTRYLISVAYERPFHEVMGALLPCFWIYQRTGEELLARGSPDALYRRWIETYGGEEYGRTVRRVLELAERVTAALDEPRREALGRHFVTTSRLEWMFWEMAWRQESWPV